MYVATALIYRDMALRHADDFRVAFGSDHILDVASPISPSSSHASSVGRRDWRADLGLPLNDESGASAVFLGHRGMRRQSTPA